MLKAKKRSHTNPRMAAAMKEVSKLDNDKAVFARITTKEMRKLNLELLDRDMTMAAWVKEKIGEI